jgi:hypothetical protein
MCFDVNWRQFISKLVKNRQKKKKKKIEMSKSVKKCQKTSKNKVFLEKKSFWKKPKKSWFLTFFDEFWAKKRHGTKSVKICQLTSIDVNWRQFISIDVKKKMSIDINWHKLTSKIVNLYQLTSIDVKKVNFGSTVWQERIFIRLNKKLFYAVLILLVLF